MMKTITLLFLVFTVLSCSAQKKEINNVFYPFNNSMRSLPNAPESVEEQVALVKRLGYDGFAGHSSDDYFKRRSELDKAGLKMPEIYYSVFLDSTKNVSYNQKLKEIIKDAENKELVVTLVFRAKSFKGTRAEADDLYLPTLIEIADYASQYNVKVAIYPHVKLYVEEIGHAVDLAKRVNRKNFGVAFNTCHFLSKEGDANWEEKLTAALPYLFMLSVAGADDGETTKFPMNKLIYPLGEGSYDIYKYIKFVKDHGYNGPVGLQCFGIKQDCEVALAKSIETWKSYKQRYAKEK